MGRIATERAGIVRFWRAVELFEPAGIDRPNPHQRVYEIDPGGPLPWEDGHPLSRVPAGRDRVWRHTVYCGVYSLDQVHAELERTFGRDGENFDGGRRGETALLALTVDAEGRALVGSQVLSSCAWATGRCRWPGPGAAEWMDGFDDTRDTFDREFAELVTESPGTGDGPGADGGSDPSGKPRPLALADLRDCAKLAAELLGVGDVLDSEQIRVRSHTAPATRLPEAEGQDFLNSFLTGDLDRVAAAVDRGDYGTALAAYLRDEDQIDTERRVDVRERPQEVFDGVAPHQLPPARWPNATDRPLALSQQFAVDRVMAELEPTSGIFGVNGPPGTGKTTKLRDVVAAVVTERARRLAELRRPEDAFTGKYNWKTGEYHRVVHTWDESLTGHEIVVASTNNGAVENITTEIPGAAAVGEQWAGEAGYFAEVAAEVLGEPAWGTLAARLGSRKNRQEFCDAFWPRRAQGREAQWANMRRLLHDFEAQPAGPQAWADAVREFRRAYQRVTEMRTVRDGVYQNMRRLPEAERATERAQREHAAAQQRVAELRADVPGAQQALDRAQAELDACARKWQDHRQDRPNLTEALFTLGRAVREWRARRLELVRAATAAEDRQQAARAELDELTTGVEAAERESEQHRRTLEAAEREVERLRAEVGAAREQWGECVPGSDWYDDEEGRELAAPWSDEEFNAARTRAFLAALDLHAAFLAAAPRRMRQNLDAAVDAVTGAIPSEVPEHVVRAAWQSLFFVVPVVSTTFASMGRLFRRLGRESLGWLLIDEAGQATPQAAAGALWRARRAVVVGDPLQLEPVVTLPYTAQQALRRHYGVEEKWVPRHVSVQRLADEVTGVGTYLPGREDGPIWVGAPLRVHRRCDEPMFDISNRVAYGGLMVDGVPPRSGLGLPESSWVDVSSNDSDGHWIPEEGKALRDILVKLTSRGHPPEEIFVIAPFRDVARRAGRIASEFGVRNSGTVHTAQGKEADVVVFVLGGDPSRPGARSWAAKRPNMVNVAASRARRLLYVVGDHDAWSPHPHFDVLSGSLPRRQWAPRPPGFARQ